LDDLIAAPDPPPTPAEVAVGAEIAPQPSPRPRNRLLLAAGVLGSLLVFGGVVVLVNPQFGAAPGQPAPSGPGVPSPTTSIPVAIGPSVVGRPGNADVRIQLLTGGLLLAALVVWVVTVLMD